MRAVAIESLDKNVPVHVFEKILDEKSDVLAFSVYRHSRVSVLWKWLSISPNGEMIYLPR